MNKRIAISFIIIISFTANTIKPVQAESGSKPDKTLFVLENAIYFLIRKTLLTVDSFEPDIFLRKQNGREKQANDIISCSYHLLKLKIKNEEWKIKKGTG